MLSSVLPKPSKSYDELVQEHKEKNAPQTDSAPRAHIPPYGKRDNFIPRSIADFGDGGAFPEIHVAQYPLNMGKPADLDKSIVPVSLDSDGKIKYENILGHGPKGQTVHARANAMKEKQFDEDDLQRPSAEIEAEITSETRNALNSIVSGKVDAIRPTTVNTGSNSGGPTYIRYIPQRGHAGHTGEINQRIISMVEMPRDPLEPPKFKHKRVPAGPPEPPVPVMHAPGKKLTLAEQQAWKIPPCISNWKNAKGYTIPLDKRLAADGRGIKQVQINDNFAKLSESLYIAARKAREEVRRRNELQNEVLARQRREKQEKLRLMADRARRERTGSEDEESNDEEDEMEEEDETMSKRERDELRHERKRERERKRHIANYKGKKNIDRDADRDIGEKIALGEAPRNSRETMYDQRLFNQDQGIAAGFGSDDSYNIYSKPLFAGSSANILFRPKKSNEDTYGSRVTDEELLNTAKFKPARDFSGVDRSKSNKRSGPVEFEGRRKSDSDDDDGVDEEDELGLESFLNEVQESQRKNPLKNIGKTGGMLAAGGGGGGSNSYDRLKERESTAGQREKVQFKRAREEPTTNDSDIEMSVDDYERKRKRSRSRSPRSERSHRDHHSRDREREKDREYERSRHSRRREHRHHSSSHRHSHSSSSSRRRRHDSTRD